MPVIMPLTVLFASSSKIIISSALLFFSLMGRTPAFAETQFAFPLLALLGLLSCTFGWTALQTFWRRGLTQGIPWTEGGWSSHGTQMKSTEAPQKVRVEHCVG